MRRVLVAVAAGSALWAPPAAEAAGPRYRFVATSALTVTVTSTCTTSETGARTIETMTWALESRHSGTSAIGRGARQPKGSTLLTGTLRRETTRRYEGGAQEDPGSAPQGGTEPLQEDHQTRGVLYRAGSSLELRLSHLGLPDPRFAPLAKGQSKTIDQSLPVEASTTEQAATERTNCVDEERRELSRRIVITRLK